MNNDEVKKLANLARLDLNEEEVAKYSKDLEEILGYVKRVNDISGTDDEGRIESAGVRNVFREDVNPHESGEYTEDLINGAPDSQDGFVKVKKIL
jgi:aspartyl-tRNA(Asn)/glutamyl-tRNA(Gln) amidotransferase subunit C